MFHIIAIRPSGDIMMYGIDKKGSFFYEFENEPHYYGDWCKWELLVSSIKTLGYDVVEYWGPLT